MPTDGPEVFDSAGLTDRGLQFHVALHVGDLCHLRVLRLDSIDQEANGHPGSQVFYRSVAEGGPSGPTTAARMQKYAQSATGLATSACHKALDDASTEASEITHLITVSCSGFAAPGVDVQLISELGLPAGDDAPLLIDPATGRPVGPDAVPLHLRRAKVTRISIEANAGICRGMLAHRYATPGQGQTLPTQHVEEDP